MDGVSLPAGGTGLLVNEPAGVGLGKIELASNGRSLLGGLLRLRCLVVGGLLLLGGRLLGYRLLRGGLLLGYLLLRCFFLSGRFLIRCFLFLLRCRFICPLFSRSFHLLCLLLCGSSLIRRCCRLCSFILRRLLLGRLAHLLRVGTRLLLDPGQDRALAIHTGDGRLLRVSVPDAGYIPQTESFLIDPKVVQVLQERAERQWMQAMAEADGNMPRYQEDELTRDIQRYGLEAATAGLPQIMIDRYNAKLALRADKP